MKKNFILTIALFATVTLSACSEIEDGVNRMDEWEDEKIEVDYPASFVHPGIMHTNNDIERLREIVTNREQPGYGCYEIFASDARSKADYTLQGPYKEIYRGNDNGTRPSIQGKYESDFIALTYTLMFGIMFGDVGQGLCLLIGGFVFYRIRQDRKSTRLNSSHRSQSRMPSSA